MEDSQKLQREDAALAAAVVIYTIVLFAAFAIGFYGLLSLFWMASDTVQRSGLF